MGTDQQLPKVNVISSGVKGHLVSLHITRCWVPGDPETGLGGLRGLKVPRSLEARHWKQWNQSRILGKTSFEFKTFHYLMSPQH